MYYVSKTENNLIKQAYQSYIDSWAQMTRFPILFWYLIMC
jgi:hypothetical protein